MFPPVHCHLRDRCRVSSTMPGPVSGQQRRLRRRLHPRARASTRRSLRHLRNRARRADGVRRRRRLPLLDSECLQTLCLCSRVAGPGYRKARQALGVNSTGLPFNSVMAIELLPSRTGNPLVNAGAIATTALAPGETSEAKWNFIQSGVVGVCRTLARGR